MVKKLLLVGIDYKPTPKDKDFLRRININESIIAGQKHGYNFVLKSGEKTSIIVRNGRPIFTLSEDYFGVMEYDTDVNQGDVILYKTMKV